MEGLQKLGQLWAEPLQQLTEIASGDALRVLGIDRTDQPLLEQL